MAPGAGIWARRPTPDPRPWGEPALALPQESGTVSPEVADGVPVAEQEQMSRVRPGVLNPGCMSGSPGQL